MLLPANKVMRRTCRVGTRGSRGSGDQYGERQCGTLGAHVQHRLATCEVEGPRCRCSAGAGAPGGGEAGVPCRCGCGCGRSWLAEASRRAGVRVALLFGGWGRWGMPAI